MASRINISVILVCGERSIHKRYISIFVPQWDNASNWNPSFLEVKERFVLNSQYNSYSWPGEEYSQSGTSHGIDLFIMMTSSNENIFCVTGHLCGNSPVTGEFPTQRPVTRSFDVFFDLRRNKRLSKQSWGWWFGTLSRPLWRHCNYGIDLLISKYCNRADSRFAPSQCETALLCNDVSHWLAASLESTLLQR